MRKWHKDKKNFAFFSIHYWIFWSRARSVVVVAVYSILTVRLVHSSSTLHIPNDPNETIYPNGLCLHVVDVVDDGFRCVQHFFDWHFLVGHKAVQYPMHTKGFLHKIDTTWMALSDWGIRGLAKGNEKTFKNFFYLFVRRFFIFYFFLSFDDVDDEEFLFHINIRAFIW